MKFLKDTITEANYDKSGFDISLSVKILAATMNWGGNAPSAIRFPISKVPYSLAISDALILSIFVLILSYPFNLRFLRCNTILKASFLKTNLSRFNLRSFLSFPGKTQSIGVILYKSFTKRSGTIIYFLYWVIYNFDGKFLLVICCNKAWGITATLVVPLDLPVTLILSPTRIYLAKIMLFFPKDWTSSILGALN